MNNATNQNDINITGRPSLIAERSEPSQLHRVSAIYATREEAERVRQDLISNGIAADAVELLDDLAHVPVAGGSDDVLKDMLVDGAIGTAVGTGVGAIGTVMLWAASVTLFVASPLVAPLAMLGWFASVGGIAGAVAGAASDQGKNGKEGKFSELVMDSIQAGNVVLVVHTHGESDRELAKVIIGKSLSGHGVAPTDSN
jgi:hypothetical protein